MQISQTKIKDGSVFVIAEAGINHNGDVELATELIDAAATAGADAIKFQTYSSDRLVAKETATATYQNDQTGAEPTQRELIREFELDESAHRELMSYCDDVGITFLSTPFDAESVSLLDELDLAAIKVGSGDLTDHRLLRGIATLGRPMIVSTGMSTEAEVKTAAEVIDRADPDVDVSFLHCVSAYPTEMTDVNLRAIRTLDELVDGPVGFSDHTLSVETPGFAVAAGAKIVEKHLTLDQSMPGPDHDTSLEPDDLARAIDLARDAAAARGTPTKEPVPAEAEPMTLSRKSLHAVDTIREGDRISADQVAILRPATGLPPSTFDAVVGSIAAVDIDPQSPIVESDVEGSHKETLSNG